MKFDPKIPFDQAQGRHHRRSIRLKGYDYSQTGAYFVTLVTRQRGCLFGLGLFTSPRDRDNGPLLLLPDVKAMED
jgi:hypothetical protein